MDIVQDNVHQGAAVPTWNVRFDLGLDTQNPEIVSSVAKANALASVIRGIPLPPAVQERIDALNILRAVRGTTGIEGSQLTEAEVRLIMEERTGRKAVLHASRKREEQEARNAEDLMYFVADVLGENPGLPLTEELVCKMHTILTQGIEYSNNTPGKYRNHAVSAGSYIPPQTGEEVGRLMHQFISWFNEGPPTHWHPILRALVAHFYVVSIHPFGDGNGRTARGVESFLLYQGQVNVRGFYSLANHYYRNREQYVGYLDDVRFRTKGDLTPFVVFALRGLVSELEFVHQEIIEEVREFAFRDYARETLAEEGKLATPTGDRMFHFLLGLGRDPLSLKSLRQGQHPLSWLYRNVTTKTLSRDINFLKQVGLVIVEGDALMANLQVMDRFVPPHQFRARKRRAARTIRRKR